MRFTHHGWFVAGGRSDGWCARALGWTPHPRPRDVLIDRRVAAGACSAEKAARWARGKHQVSPHAQIPGAESALFSMSQEANDEAKPGSDALPGSRGRGRDHDAGRTRIGHGP